MIRSSWVEVNSEISRSGARAWKCAGVALAAGVMLLSAPFVNSPRHEELALPPAEPGPAAPAESRVAVKLRRGDTLAAILNRFGIQRVSAHALIAKVRPFVNPKRLQTGDQVHVVLNPGDQTVEGLELVVDDELVRVTATDDGWRAQREQIPFVREKRTVRGVIKGSLYESGIDAGLSPQQILDLAKIFEYDIDFFSDFQPQNAFSVVIEDLRYADGRRAAGRVLAAELEASSDHFDAYRFTVKDGSSAYYSAKGEALHRSFLRAPLSYARISSPFNRKRMHPIFRKVRPHLAIDYAAPAGSPVVAIGKGRVEFAGWRNGYGKVVDIRHSGSYLSRYAHFSRIAGNLRKGQSVNAGEVIGYVGQTGHATGPHLHFEFLRGGTKINFLDLRIPKSEQLAGAELERFHRLRDERQALLRDDKDRVVEVTHRGS